MHLSYALLIMIYFIQFPDLKKKQPRCKELHHTDI